MTSSGLEWDYYEFQPVESSSVEYATPGANSFLLPANTENSYWDPNAISEWSMSIHTAHTSEIVKEKVVPVKEIKDEKDKRNQKRKARKEPRRSEREKEVRNLVHRPCLELDISHGCMLRNLGLAVWRVTELLRGAWLHGGLCAGCSASSFVPCMRSLKMSLGKQVDLKQRPEATKLPFWKLQFKKQKINFKWNNNPGFIIISS